MTETMTEATIAADTPEAPFDLSSGEAIDAAFPSIHDYESFLLEDIGIVKWFRGTKEERNGRMVTTGYGFIQTVNGDVYFRLPGCQKYEFDPETNSRKFVRQYRRVNPGQSVTFSLKESDRGLRTDLFIFWEPEEFEKVVKQETYCQAFPHRLVTVTKRIDQRLNRTISIDEDVLWEGVDLNAFRSECPRINSQFKVFKLAPQTEDGVKTLVSQRVEYRDMLNGAEHKPWVICLDPR